MNINNVLNLLIMKYLQSTDRTFSNLQFVIMYNLLTRFEIISVVVYQINTKTTDLILRENSIAFNKPGLVMSYHPQSWSKNYIRIISEANTKQCPSHLKHNTRKEEY